MLNKLSEIWRRWCREGVHFPYAYDPVENKPSVTLLFPYITFVIMSASLLAVHFAPDILPATFTTILVWAISVIFYRLRKLDKVKIDINDQSIELDSQDEDKKGE